MVQKGNELKYNREGHEKPVNSEQAACDNEMQNGKTDEEISQYAVPVSEDEEGLGFGWQCCADPRRRHFLYAVQLVVVVAVHKFFNLHRNAPMRFAKSF